MIPTIALSYRHGSSGHFISACVNAIRINELSDIQISKYGEYMYYQYPIHQIWPFNTPLSLQTISQKTIYITHYENINTLLQTFHTVLTISFTTPGDIIVSYMNGISKFIFGGSTISNSHKEVAQTKQDIYKFLFENATNNSTAQDQFNLLPEHEQRDILMWGCMRLNTDLNYRGCLDFTIPLKGEYQLPYSCIRYGETDTFIKFIDNIIPLDAKSEDFVRRNSINYYNKQNRYKNYQ